MYGGGQGARTSLGVSLGQGPCAQDRPLCLPPPWFPPGLLTFLKAHVGSLDSRDSFMHSGCRESRVMQRREGGGRTVEGKVTVPG